MSIYIDALRDIEASGWPLGDEVADEIERFEREIADLRTKLEEATHRLENVRDMAHIRKRQRDNWKKRAEEAERKLAAAQAQIDALMLEYCPDEMTPEQIENWKQHQRVVSPEETAAINEAIRAKMKEHK